MTLGFKVGIHLGLKSGGVASAPTPAQLVETDLSGTTGWALDPNDTTRLWQDSAKTTPVTTVADPVGAADTKYGTTVYTFLQATSARRPAWTGAAIDYDVVDDFLGEGATYSYSSSQTAKTVTVRVRVDALAAIQTVYVESTNSGATTTRYRIQILTTGAVQVFCRRADGDSGTTVTSSAGVITAGVAATIQVVHDFTTDAVTIYVGGTSVGTGTQGGTTGTASSAGASLRMRFGANLAATELLDGRIGRVVHMRAAASLGQRTNHATYVEEFAI